jgi:hypothetical protein
VDIPKTQAEAREKAADGKYYLPGLTHDETAELLTDEAEVRSTGIEHARKFQKIRSQKLWQKITDGQVNRRYASFDDYCDERLGISRQQVTHITKGLARNDELAVMRAKGLNVPAFLSASAVE